MKINKHMKFDMYSDDFRLKESEEIENIHMKFIPKEVKHKVYKIRYNYTTVRRNLKENFKYIISEDSADAKLEFLEYIKEFNKNNQHRMLSNVNILEANYVGDIIQSY